MSLGGFGNDVIHFIGLLANRNRSSPILFYDCDSEERRGHVWGEKGCWKIMTAYALEINEHLCFFSVLDLC